MERAPEIVLVIASLWPAMRVCASRTYWRVNRRAAAAAAFGVAVGLALAVAAANGPPTALRLLAMGALLGAAVLHLRSRPGFGSARHLPPGRLTILPPLAAVRDSRFIARQAARFGPVFKVGGLRHPVVCVIGLARALDLLRRFDDALVAPAMPFSREIPKGYLRYQAPADHARYRQAFQRALSRELVAGLAPRFAHNLRRGLEAMASASAESRRRGVHPARFVRESVFPCLTECLLGIAGDDHRYPALLEAFRGIDHRKTISLYPARGRRAIAAIGALAGRPTSPCALAGLADVAPELTSDLTAVGNLAYMARAAGDDLSDYLCWLVKMVADHPVFLERLRADAARASEPGSAPPLALRVALETLRLAQTEYIHRVARRDVEIEGFVIPRGWLVRVCVRESHRDPDAFADPDRFDPDRFLGGRPPATVYSPFGATRHACLGEHLVLTVASAFLSELARSFRLEKLADGPEEMGQFHWRPSHRQRIRLTRLV